MHQDTIYHIRHSLAHICAAVMLEKYPGTQLGIGPVIEHGFYYDFLTPTQITQGDLVSLEQKMRTLIKKNLDFVRSELTIAEALRFFSSQPFKKELINDLAQKGEKNVSLYTSGTFIDLCQGPHVSNTKEIPLEGFRLTKIAGAYWRGDEKNQMLTRIYGVAFMTKKELDDYLLLQEELLKRDHKKIGKEQELFTIIPEIGSGLPLFYPKGALLRSIVEKVIFDLQEKKGYQSIWLPHLTKSELYQISGHLEKYDALYPPMKLEGESEYYIKPMNCPHFMLLYNSTPHSYRELPIRWVSTTTVYRYEKSGELSGLLRVRAITQDDCHVFATPAQMEKEILLMLSMIQEVYRIFGFKDFWVRISTHDPHNKEKYIGDKNIWKESEAILTKLIQKKKWKYEIGIGEAAFYGPKLDFIIRDALGREWQLSTIQLDMNLPERFSLTYIDQEGNKKRPIVIHRAILGSTERFLAILIEHYGGAFPLWLAPEQIWVCPLGKTHHRYAKEVTKQLTQSSFRAVLKNKNESIGKKIREGEKQKIPYLLIIGDQEVKRTLVAVRKRNKGDLGTQKVSLFIKYLRREVEKRQ